MLVEKALLPAERETADPSRYFVSGELLVDRGQGRQFAVPGVPLLYLRVIPTTAGTQLRRADAVDLIRQGPVHLDPLYYRQSSVSFEPNEYGAIALAADYERGLILAAAQLFLNREIWGFNATLFDPNTSRKRGIPTLSVEQSLAVSLRKYLHFAESKLQLEPPFRIEAGAVGIKGYVIHMPSNFIESEWGPIQQHIVRWRGIISSTDPASVDAALLAIFDEFFDAGGARRPSTLYSFPGTTPGATPKG